LTDAERATLEHAVRATTDPEPCRELARALEGEGELHAAARAQRMAAARRPDRPWDHFVSARLTIAAADLESRNPKLPLPAEETDDVRLPGAEEASIALRMALEIDPDFGAAHRELARLDVNRARVLKDEVMVKVSAARAISRCAEALKLDPSDAETHRVLGDVSYHVLARYSEARDHYLRAVELAPDNADARALLAAAYLKEGDSDAAYREVTQALAVAPQHELAHQLLKDIR